MLDKRIARKKEKGEEFELKTRKRSIDEEGGRMKKRVNVDDMLSSVF